MINPLGLLALFVLAAIIAVVGLLMYALFPPPREWITARNIYHTKLKCYLPVPSWQFPAGAFGPMIDDYRGWFESQAGILDKYGALPVWHVSELYVILPNADDIKALLFDNDLNYTREFDALYLLKRLFGKGILAVDGEEWRSQHRLLYKAFTRDNLKAFRPAYLERINSCCQLLCSTSQGSKPLELQPLLQSTTLGVMCDVAFGNTLTQDEQIVLRDCITHVTNELTNPAHQIPVLRHIFADQSKLKACFASLYGIVAAAIQRRREGEQMEDANTYVHRYLIDLILSAGEEDSESDYHMSDETIRDNVLSFFAAGTETTATAMTWTWSQLLQHDDVLDKARQEADKVTDDDLLAEQDLDKLLPLITQVIKETMRLTPSLDANFGRTLKSQQQIGDIVYPKGARLIAFAEPPHHNPEYFPDPDVFKPERFAPEASIRQGSYVPFGVGRRLCIGRRMAMEEMQVMMCKALQQLQVVHAGKPEELSQVFYKPPLLYPKDGLKVTVAQRA